MKTYFTVLVIILLNFTIKAQDLQTIITEISKDFPEGTELSISLINEGNTNYYGFETAVDDIKSKKNKNTVFEIGSISKVFTSTLLAYMIKEEKVKAEDPIKKHMKYRLKGNPKISLQQLSNHTSGLPRLPENIMPLLQKNPMNPYKNYNEELLNEYLKKEIQLKRDPGKEYEYSNLGAGLLGKILSDKNKSTYEEALQQYIFGPLQMKSTTTERKKVSDKLINGKGPMGMDTQNWDFDVLAPAGAVLSSVSDLQKFVLANLEGKDKALNLQQQATFTVNENLDMAMAWHLLKKEGKSLLFHNGKTGGYTSAMLLDGDGKKAVIILSNLSAFHPKGNNIDVLAFKLMEMLEKEEKGKQ